MLRSRSDSLNSDISGDPEDPYVILKKYFRHKEKMAANSKAPPPKVKLTSKNLTDANS